MRDVCCDVTSLEADIVTVDALCRLQLAARRRGCRVVLMNASERLRRLVELMGLEDVLPDYESNSSGRPNSGNSVAVSRKKVSSPILPLRASTTWSAQGS